MKVGLTGGIGCGKTTVVGFFREAGWRTLELDRVVAECLSVDVELQAALRARWGDAVFTQAGEVDRRAIGRRVFLDAAELSWLEQLVHPRVRMYWQGAVAAAPGADWLVEIPLLFEKRLESAFDLTVCVCSPPKVVDVRMAARNYSAQEVERRRQRQMPLDEKMRRAEHVITNAGSLQFLNDQTMRLIQQISGE